MINQKGKDCNYVSDHVCKHTNVCYLQNTRMVTFFEYPKYSLALPCPIIPPKGYPLAPKIIGERIRKKRFDLGLLQREVAEMIGVAESTVWNWEHGTEPELRYIPKIIEFLCYVPFECPEDPIGKLIFFKKVKGLSYERLGKIMGRDPEQLTDWLNGRKKPCKRNMESIDIFLIKIEQHK